jgi:rubrerythrin
MISLKSIQTEIDASYLYKILAENEEDEAVAEVFKQMSEIEHSHAVAFIQKNNLTESDLPSPSFRAKTLHKTGKVFGYDYVLGGCLNSVFITIIFVSNIQ